MVKMTSDSDVRFMSYERLKVFKVETLFACIDTYVDTYASILASLMRYFGEVRFSTKNIPLNPTNLTRENIPITNLSRNNFLNLPVVTS